MLMGTIPSSRHNPVLLFYCRKQLDVMYVVGTFDEILGWISSRVGARGHYCTIATERHTVILVNPLHLWTTERKIWKVRKLEVSAPEDWYEFRQDGLHRRVVLWCISQH
jgi:hypothetical protein